LKEWSPNRIAISTEGEAGKLMFSEIYYPGWKAWVDGKLVEINREYGILRCIELSSGSHEVVMKFLPATFFVGAAISLMGWLAYSFLEMSQRFKIRTRIK
jgi:uncharacterized membrane protein YfhO